eukprot:gene17792-24166_t
MYDFCIVSELGPKFDAYSSVLKVLSESNDVRVIMLREPLTLCCIELFFAMEIESLPAVRHNDQILTGREALMWIREQGFDISDDVIDGGAITLNALYMQCKAFDSFAELSKAVVDGRADDVENC